MSKLTFKPKKMSSIRGTRFYYEVIKEIDNIPGFAPETYMSEVCDVVVKFLDNEPPYIQFSDNCPNVITIEEMEEIIECAKNEFIEKDFNS